ncbi:hypothetical protein WME76_24880 [Sorangium sp. So ce119]|uniref:5'-methylthioadenosine/S-adenosylhomocysteine nucleosidase family protein n=1 Tax=Sorangium sp. So ce119 TaxID=3133279 RepID=UPI003F617AA1
MEVRDIRGRVDFGIITIREDEFEAVLDRFPEHLGIASGRRQYNIRRIASDDPYTVAIVRCAAQANSEAQQVANALLDELQPRWLLVVGIGGGAPAFEFTLGDVVVATEVCDFNVGAVLKDGSHEYALHGWMSHIEVAKLAANLPAMRKQLGAWNSAKSVHCERPGMKISPRSLYGDANWKKKVRKTLEHHLTEGRQEPKVTAGAIACSDIVMKDAELFQAWLKFTRQVIAVEMESAGVHKAAQDRHVPFMSIRGLSDIVGLSRDPKWTAYACHSAAAFTRAFLLTRPIPPHVSKHYDPAIGHDLGQISDANPTRTPIDANSVTATTTTSYTVGHGHLKRLPVPDRILDQQFDQLNQLAALFEGKSELDLRQDAALDELIVVNWLRTVDDYAYISFRMEPKDVKERPYNRIGRTVITTEGLIKYYRPVDSHVRPDPVAQDTNDAPKDYRSVPWAEYDLFELKIPDRLGDLHDNLMRFVESRFIPEECISLIRAYADALSYNERQAWDLLREAAREFPYVYANFDVLRRATPESVLFRFTSRVHHLKGPADAILAFVRKFLTVDAVTRVR